MSIYKLEDVSKYYINNDNVNLGISKVNLSFDLNEIVAITGESGSGKSTLANILGGIDVLDDGSLYFEGEDISHFTVADYERFRAQNIGFVFQNYHIIESYSVYQNILLALEIQNYPREMRKSRALELIDLVGLKDFKDHKASKLSGGQKQRCVIARALAKDSKIIIADEPTGNLDSESSKQIIELLSKISKDKLIVIVTHDFELIKDFATRKIKMHDGDIVEDKKLKNVKESNLVYEEKEPKVPLHTIMKFALRNLVSTPKKFVFNVFLHTTIIFFFTLMFLVITKAFEDSISGPQYYRYYENFSVVNLENLSDNRFLIARMDSQDFTEDEINSFKSNPYNSHIYTKPTWIDTYDIGGVLFKDSNYNRVYVDTFGINSGLFDSTFSILSKERFIKGRLPVSFDEIVVSSALGVNTDFTIDFYDSKYFDYDVKITVENGEIIIGEVEDAPYIDYPSYTLKYRIGSFYYSYYINSPDDLSVEYLDTMEIDPESYDSLYLGISGEQVIDRVFKVVGVIDEGSISKIYFHHNYLDENSTYDMDNLISVVSGSNTDAQNFFESIDRTTYRVIYPKLDRMTSNSLSQFLLFVVTSLGYIIIIMIGVILYLILYAVLRNLMKSKMKDFSIYRSIGANKKMLSILVIFEMLYVTIMSTIISIIGIVILSHVSLSFIFLTEEFTFSHLFMLIVILLILSVRLSLKFNRKIFKFTVIDGFKQSKVSL